MASLVRITSRWDGFPGSPGYTNFYGVIAGPTGGAAAQSMTDDIHGFWNTVNGYLPADVTITIVPTYQVIDDATGQITEEGTVGTPAAAVTGNYGGLVAGNAGVAINWSTGKFINGHRLKGRTYLVPFAGCQEPNGTLALAAITAIHDSAEAMLGDHSLFMVWHRPVNGAGGDSSEILSATVRDRSAILRSRSI